MLKLNEIKVHNLHLSVSLYLLLRIFRLSCHRHYVYVLVLVLVLVLDSINCQTRLRVKRTRRWLKKVLTYCCFLSHGHPWTSKTRLRNKHHYLARMRNMDQKGTVIFGRSGRAQIMALKYGAYTRILFILSICFTDFQSDSMVTEIAFKICRLWAVAVTRLYGASHSCFGFIISYKSGSICMPY